MKRSLIVYFNEAMVTNCNPILVSVFDIRTADGRKNGDKSFVCL